jgi:DNA-binding transcriptional LysR family regulator
VRNYPQVELEIVAEDRKVDPVDENCDIVLRIDPDHDEQLVGRLIMQDERLLVALPGAPIDFQDEQDDSGRRVPAVGHTATPADIRWRIRTNDAVRAVRPHFGLRFSSFLMIRDAVLASAGIALMPKLLVNEDIIAGRFVSRGAEAGAKVEVWALQNSRRLSSSKVRAFLDALPSITR